MKKLDSIRKGRLWLNVFETPEGQRALTIRKSFPSRDGGWKQTDFLRPDLNDLKHLKSLLDEYALNEEEQKYGDGSQ